MPSDSTATSRNRRPRLLKLAIFVLLGAIVNVAVAWGCVGLLTASPAPNQTLEAVEQQIARDELLRVFDNSAITTDHCFGTQESRFGWTIRHCHCWAAGRNAVYWEITAKYAGWPMFSLDGIQTSTRSSVAEDTKEVRGSVSISRTGTTGITAQHNFLPFRPLWPGFAINTIFYAAILALLFFGPGKLRRYIRIRKCQCPTCGFIIAPGTCANGVCSECGALLPEGIAK